MRTLTVTILVLLHVSFAPSLAAQLPGDHDTNDKSSSLLPPIATNGQPFPWIHMRLPETVSPIHYDLLVHPNLTSLDFTGEVQIQLQVFEDTSTIILHSKDLQIAKAELLAPEGPGSLPVYDRVPSFSTSVVIRVGVNYI